MRIEQVETIPIEIPLKRNFGGSTYNVLKRCTIVTRVRTNGGLASEVYNGDNREHMREVVDIVQQELVPLILGQDAGRIELLWQKMYTITRRNRDRQLAMEAIACIDTALWDLLGKACGLSVWKLLGGYRDKLPIISSVGYYEDGKSSSDLVKEVEWLKSVGMGGCKVKVGGLTPERDAQRVAAVREAAGKEFIVAVDANRGWSADDAIRFSHLIEHLDITWFEEPCHWDDDAYTMARVRQATRIPINAGQSEMTSHGVRRLITAGAVDYVNVGVSEFGGITEWRKAAGMCAVFGVKLTHHEEPQLATHLLGAVPSGTIVPNFANPERDPVWHRLLVNRPSIKDGFIEVPQGPGFALQLDEAMIKQYRVD
jgi:D-galactarolactone cycloisomerase